MSRIFICPYAKTIAFGGVATGSMNANEAETVTGSIRYSGFTSILVACVQNRYTTFVIFEFVTRKSKSYTQGVAQLQRDQ